MSSGALRPYVMTMNTWAPIPEPCSLIQTLLVKGIRIVLCALLATHGGLVNGQNTGDCFNAIPVCQGVYNEANSPPGEGDLPDEINPANSCLGGGEVNGQWYTFSVQNSGQFCFSIIPNNLQNDYDWAVFNLTNADCDDIYTNAALEVSCNFSGMSGITGANGSTGNQNEPCMQVQVGQTFALYVSNWSQSPYGYTLDMQVPGTTASIFDGTPPAVDAVLTGCSRTSVTVSFSEFILCSSAQPADFLITGPGGPYTPTGLTSPVCAAGGEQTDEFVLTVTPPLTGQGPFQVVLVGQVEDLCNNFNTLNSTFTFSMPEEMVITAQATPTGCAQANTGTIAGTVTGGQAPLIYNLNGGNSQINSGTYGNLGAGTYTIGVTDAQGCTASTTAQITILTNFSSTIQTVNASCAGSADGTAAVQTTGVGTGWNYTWRDQADAVVRQTTNTNTDTLVAGPGTYTVVVQEAVAGTACSDTLTFTLTEPDPFELTLLPVDTTICIDGTATLATTGTGGTLPYTMQWTHGLVGPGPHQVMPTVDQAYTLSASDAHGCSVVPISFTVHVRDSLQARPLLDMDACKGIPFTLDIGEATGGDGAYTYTWSNGTPSASQTTDSLSVAELICVTVRDGCETPTFSTCAQVTVLYTPAIEITTDTTLGCRPFEVGFQLRDTTAGALVHWNFGEGLFADEGPTITHIYDRSGLFDVGLEIKWPNGCMSDTLLEAHVQVIPVPTADFVYKPEPLTVFEPEGRFVETTEPNEVGYAWDFFDFGTATGPDTTITFPDKEGGLYPVQLVVWNELGCLDTLFRWIPVEDVFLVHVPNTFTPNGDGLNEIFLVTGNDLSDEEFELHIFDRWGDVVFSSITPDLGWDGKLPGGTHAMTGVYNWRLKARSIQTTSKRIVYGHVTLLQ